MVPGFSRWCFLASNSYLTYEESVFIKSVCSSTKYIFLGRLQPWPQPWPCSRIFFQPPRPVSREGQPAAGIAGRCRPLVESDKLGLRYLKYCFSFGSASLVTTMAAFVGWTWSGILEWRSLPWCGADKLKYLIKVGGMKLKPERIFFMDQKWAGRQCHAFSMDMCQMALLQSAQKFVGKFWYLVNKWSQTHNVPLT